MIKLTNILKEIQIQGRITPEMVLAVIEDVNWRDGNDEHDKRLFKDYKTTVLYNLYNNTHFRSEKEFLDELSYETLVKIYKEVRILAKKYPKPVNEIQVQVKITPEMILNFIKNINWDNGKARKEYHDSTLRNTHDGDDTLSGENGIASFLKKCDYSMLMKIYNEFKEMYKTYPK